MHNDKIEEKLKTLPDNPGVYLMKNSNGKIIYVGKAVVLKNRVRQYFRKTEKNGRPLIQLTRNLVKDGSKYYGPYPSVWSAKEIIKYIKDIYMSILNRPFLDENLKNEEKEKIYQEIKRVLSRKYR